MDQTQPWLVAVKGIQVPYEASIEQLARLLQSLPGRARQGQLVEGGAAFRQRVHQPARGRWGLRCRLVAAVKHFG